MARTRPRPAPKPEPKTRVKGKLPRINDQVLANSKVKRVKLANGELHPFIKANHPPGVIPDDHKRTLAMDTSLDNSLAWAAQTMASAAFEEGLAFLGYPYLAEVAQRSEYRRISEIIATEMTRKWIQFKSKSPDDDKTDRINDLKDAFTNLNVQGVFREAAEQDGFFGRSHIYIDTGDTDNPDELRKPIGDGHDELSKNKIKQGSLKRLKTVEAVWCYPSDYNSNDPLQPDWYKPKEWFVQGKRLHADRLLTFVGREVPDLLKPAYSFGGLSLSQMAKPYIDNWLRTRQSVSDLVHSFSVFVLGTDMAAMLMEGNEDLFARIDLFNNLRDNRGVMVTSKEDEQFQNVSAPLGGLHELQAQSQEHICSVTGIPLIKYTGITPSGLNASSEGELRTFYDWVAAFQEKFFTHNLTKVMRFVMLHLWGEIDEDIIYVYEPLWSLDEKSIAELQKGKADVDMGYLNGNVLSPREIRGRIASDPNSAYPGLDVDDVPEQMVEEEPAEVEGTTEGQETSAEGEETKPGFGHLVNQEAPKEVQPEKEAAE